MLKRMVLPVLVLVIALMSIAGEHVFAAIAASTPNQNCKLIVPTDPLTATGLSTPYQLTATKPNDGPCNEANTAQSAFVQAAIIDLSGMVTVYAPLVIDKGTQPAIAPIVPIVPAGSVVSIWFGFNGNILTLSDHKNCVNGKGNSNFGQFAYCNAPAFFTSAKKAIIVGSLTVPPLGIAKDGLPCPTVRDFSIVDQDQSDNVQSQYLVIGNLLAQKNDANLAANPTALTISNPSDNALTTRFVDPAIGCTGFMAPDQSNAMKPTNALPLDELQAWSQQDFPTALVPLNDPMTLVDGHQSKTKTNLYRAGVGQHPIASFETTKQYCDNIVTVGLPRLILDKPMTVIFKSPVPAQGSNLFTFLASRANFTLSVQGLNCVKLLHIKNPVTLTLDGNGVATDASIKQ
jgi:hypothetical protein